MSMLKAFESRRLLGVYILPLLDHLYAHLVALILYDLVFKIKMAYG